MGNFINKLAGQVKNLRNQQLELKGQVRDLQVEVDRMASADEHEGAVQEDKRQQRIIEWMNGAIEALFQGAKEQHALDMETLRARVETLGADHVKKQEELDREESRAMMNWCSNQVEALLSSPVAEAISQGAKQLVEHRVREVTSPRVPTGTEQARAKIETSRIERQEEIEALQHRISLAKLKAELERVESGELTVSSPLDRFSFAVQEVNDLSDTDKQKFVNTFNSLK